MARYGQQKQPAACVPVPDGLAHLRLLLARLRALGDLAHQESTRLENERLDEGLRSQIQEPVRLLQGWQHDLLTQIRRWIAAHAEQAA